MKKILLFWLLFIPILLSSEISFPESLYFIYTKSDYKIMLGINPIFIEKEYGYPKEKILRHKFNSPDYEVWSMVYDDFEIWYDTYDNIITTIEINSLNYTTSMGIKIFDTMQKVINTYGKPSTIFENSRGELVLNYNKIFKEINHDGEYSTLQFTFLEEKVIKIILAIVSEV